MQEEEEDEIVINSLNCFHVHTTPLDASLRKIFVQVSVISAFIIMHKKRVETVRKQCAR